MIITLERIPFSLLPPGKINDDKFFLVLFSLFLLLYNSHNGYKYVTYVTVTTSCNVFFSHVCNVLHKRNMLWYKYRAASHRDGSKKAQLMTEDNTHTNAWDRLSKEKVL